MPTNPMVLDYLMKQGYFDEDPTGERNAMISQLSKASSAAGSLYGKRSDPLQQKDLPEDGSSKVKEYLLKKLSEKQSPVEWKESAKPTPGNKRIYFNPQTLEEREGSLVKEKPDESFNALNEPTKQFVQGMSKKIVDHTSVANSLDAEVRSMKAAIDRGDMDLAIAKGENMLKLLNSTAGQDAVGVEEAKRLASFLEFKLFNFNRPGSFIGRDVDDFVRQVAEKSDDIKKQIMSNKNMMNQAMQKNAIPDVTPIAQEVAPLKGAANKPVAPGQKIKVTNGKETLLIDPSDVENARRDGYQVVK